jgi:hypothetical protein
LSKTAWPVDHTLLCLGHMAGKGTGPSDGTCTPWATGPKSPYCHLKRGGFDSLQLVHWQAGNTVFLGKEERELFRFSTPLSPEDKQVKNRARDCDFTKSASLAYEICLLPPAVWACKSWLQQTLADPALSWLLLNSQFPFKETIVIASYTGPAIVCDLKVIGDEDRAWWHMIHDQKDSLSSGPTLLTVLSTGAERCCNTAKQKHASGDEMTLEDCLTLGDSVFCPPHCL